MYAAEFHGMMALHKLSRMYLSRHKFSEKVQNSRRFSILILATSWGFRNIKELSCIKYSKKIKNWLGFFYKLLFGLWWMRSFEWVSPPLYFARINLTIYLQYKDTVKDSSYSFTRYRNLIIVSSCALRGPLEVLD